MKKIIIYKKDKGAFMPIDSLLKDKEKIEHAIINKQNKTKLKTLPLSINLNSFVINLKKFFIMLIELFCNHSNQFFDD